jgi:hypothetical protein
MLVRAERYDAARWPGKENGNDGSLGVLNNLCEAVRSIVETVVESMHKNHRLASPHPFGGACEGCAESGLVKVLGRHRHEISMRIAGRRSWPLNVTDLAAVVGWN